MTLAYIPFLHQKIKGNKALPGEFAENKEKKKNQ